MLTLLVWTGLGAGGKLVGVIRISDRYIGRQVLLGTLYAVIVLSVVLVLGNLFQKIQPLLVDQKAPVSLLVNFVARVIPASLMYTLPWGFLSAVLMVFGRMSAHQEITCFRVSGMSLMRLSVPVFLIGACLSLISLWINVDVVPNAKSSTKEMLYRQATRDPNSMLKPGVAQGNFTDNSGALQKLLIEGREGEWVKGFHFYQLPGEEEESTYIHAARAALSVDEDKSQLRIKLDEAYFETRKPGEVPDMVFARHAEPLLIELKGQRRKSKKISNMTNQEIRAVLRDGGSRLPRKWEVELKRTLIQRFSFSMACLAFAFIAVPLSLTARRTESSRGLILSIAIGCGYFLFTLLAEQFKSLGVATVMLWLPNLLCVGLGLLLFRRARFT